MSKDLSLKGKNLKQIVKKAFPGVKLSARLDYYNSISIEIQKAPFPIFKTEKSWRTVSEYHYKNDFDEGLLTDEGFQLIHLIYTEMFKGVTYRETGDYGTQPSQYIHLYISNDVFEEVTK